MRARSHGVCERELRAMTDHPAPLEILARVEPDVSMTGEDREVLPVANATNSPHLLRRGVSRCPAIDCVGCHDAAGAPPMVGELRDEVGRPSAHSKRRPRRRWHGSAVAPVVGSGC